MLNSKRGTPKRQNILEDELLHAMRTAGWLVPETVDEVAKAEVEIAKTNISRPTSFNEPFTLLKKKIRGNYVNSVTVAENVEVTENLARAAREGGVISPTVERRMREDRDYTESKTK